MRQTIYIETSIPSFYFDTRTTPAMMAKREWTRRFWDEERHRYELVTAAPTILELESAPSPKRELTLGLVAEITELEPRDEILDIVGFYLDHKLMPMVASGDAAHLAYASFYACDRLLTWNCKHLANSNKFEHIEVVNARLKPKKPKLITPLHLLNDELE